MQVLIRINFVSNQSYVTNLMVEIFVSMEKTNDSAYNVETIFVFKFYEKTEKT